MTSRGIIEEVHSKYLKAMLLFVDFSKGFDYKANTSSIWFTPHKKKTNCYNLNGALQKDESNSSLTR